MSRLIQPSLFHYCKGNRGCLDSQWQLFKDGQLELKRIIPVCRTHSSSQRRNLNAPSLDWCDRFDFTVEFWLRQTSFGERTSFSYAGHTYLRLFKTLEPKYVSLSGGSLTKPTKTAVLEGSDVKCMLTQSWHDTLHMNLSKWTIQFAYRGISKGFFTSD